MRPPLVSRERLDYALEKWRECRLENYTLRDALMSANEEVRTLRATIVKLKQSETER